jgi:hypothetical protein
MEPHNESWVYPVSSNSNFRNLEMRAIAAAHKAKLGCAHAPLLRQLAGGRISPLMPLMGSPNQSCWIHGSGPISAANTGCLPFPITDRDENERERRKNLLLISVAVFFFSETEIAGNGTGTGIDRYTETNKYGWKYIRNRVGIGNLHRNDTLQLTIVSTYHQT